MLKLEIGGLLIMNILKLVVVIISLASVLASCGIGDNNSGANLSLINVTPVNPSIAKGTTQQLTATGIYSDGTTKNITTLISWSSSSASVATIDNTPGTSGLATSLIPGTTTITATSGEISGSTTLTVTPAILVSIVVTPADPSVRFGKSQQFTATGKFADSTVQDLTTSVIWSSTTTSVANISNLAGSNGLATLVAVGTTTITANSGEISNSTTLTVRPAELRVTEADYPAIGIDDSDYIFALWSATTSSSYTPNNDVYASRYSLNGWETPAFIGDSDLGIIMFLRLAVSPNGSAFAVWNKSTNYNIYVSRYVPGSGWGSPDVLVSPLSILDLQAAADGNGNLIVVWEVPGMPNHRLYAQKYVPEIGWDVAQFIDDNTGWCGYSHIVADNTGNAIAVWQQNDGTSTRVYANRLTAVSSWGTPTVISSNTSTKAYAPEIAMNKSGSAMAVWYEDNSQTFNAYARSFTPSMGWDAVQSIETGTSNAYEVHVAIDDVGNAVALWRQPNFWPTFYYNHYVSGFGWDTEQALADGGDLDVKMNKQGQVAVLWTQWEPTIGYQVYSKKFSPATGWGAASNLASELGSANAPHAVIDSQGNATAIWSQTIASGVYGHPTTAVFTKAF